MRIIQILLKLGDNLRLVDMQAKGVVSFQLAQRLYHLRYFITTALGWPLNKTPTHLHTAYWTDLTKNNKDSNWFKIINYCTGIKDLKNAYHIQQLQGRANLYFIKTIVYNVVTMGKHGPRKMGVIGKRSNTLINSKNFYWIWQPTIHSCMEGC
jgi:hypothetical protein